MEGDGGGRVHGQRASYGRQVDALFRKNVAYQARDWVTTLLLVAAPLFFCMVLFVFQVVLEDFLDEPEYKCDETNLVGSVALCEIAHPASFPPLLLASQYADSCGGLDVLATVRGVDNETCTPDWLLEQGQERGVREASQRRKQKICPCVENYNHMNRFVAEEALDPWRSGTELSRGNGDEARIYWTPGNVEGVVATRLSERLIPSQVSRDAVETGRLTLASTARLSLQMYADDAWLYGDLHFLADDCKAIGGSLLELETMFELYSSAAAASADVPDIVEAKQRLDHWAFGVLIGIAPPSLVAAAVASSGGASQQPSGQAIAPGIPSDFSLEDALAFWDFVPALPPTTLAALAEALWGYNLTEMGVNMSEGIPFLPSIFDAQCITAPTYEMASSADMEDTIHALHRDADARETVAAVDWGDTDPDNFLLDVTVYQNFTNSARGRRRPPNILRTTPVVSLVTRAFFNELMCRVLSSPECTASGGDYPFAATLEGLRAFPKPETTLTFDLPSVLGPVFFTWVVSLLLPVQVAQLVYEKEARLRVMMKMMGLHEASYYSITYAFNILVFIMYALIFVAFGLAIGLAPMLLNDVSVRLVFYLCFGTCMVSFSFLVTSLSRSFEFASIACYILVLASGLMGQSLLVAYIETPSTPPALLAVLEAIPTLALFRGEYELGQYSFVAVYRKTFGMRWKNLADPENGMARCMIVLAVEAVVFMLLAIYLDSVVDTGGGVPHHPLWCLGFRSTNAAEISARDEENPAPPENDCATPRSKAAAQFTAAVRREKLEAGDGVARILERGRDGAGDVPLVVIHNLKKTYPGRMGAPDKTAVHDLSLVVRRGECFGLLGPNGAGKTTTIGVMTGFVQITSGECFVDGHSVVGAMDEIYGIMGVCPQDNLLWLSLTGREHMEFYGRLKSLEGDALEAVVERGLRSVNLWSFADKPARSYSGGMKRRLSVAISLVGNPKVAYLDEPSTGLDPASRRNLWKVVNRAKQTRAVVLTTHSMEEAEVLCDRIGIFVGGRLLCLGNPRQIMALHGSNYILHVQTDPCDVGLATDSVTALCQGDPGAAGPVILHALAGSLTFAVPLSDLRPATAFVARAFAHFNRGDLGFDVRDWGIHSETLEEVFVALTDP